MAEFLTDEQMASLEKKKVKSFISDDEMNAIEKSSVPQITPKESFATSTLKGLTLGASKYPLAAIGSIAEGIPYKESLKLAEEFTKESKAQNPGVSLTGEIAGLASPLGLAGKLFGMATKGASYLPTASKLAKSVAAGATGGAATGAISAKTSGEDVGKGAATGALVGGALPIAAEGLKKGVGYAQEAGKSILAGLRNISKTTLDTVSKRPQEVEKVAAMIKDNTFIPTVAEDLTTKIKDFVVSRTDAIDEVLSQSNKPVSMKPVKDFVNNLVSEMEAIQATPLQVRQVGLLKQQQELLNNLPDELAATQFNTVKKQVQEMATSAFNDAGIKSSSLDKAMLRLENTTRDELNKAFPAVKALNAELSQAIKLQEKIGLKNAFKGDAMDAGKLQSFLKTLGNDAKAQTSRLVEEFDELIGTNLKDSSVLYRAADDVITGSAAKNPISAFVTGARNFSPVVGSVLGSLGGTPGTVIGGLAGAALQSPAATRPLMSIGGGAAKAGKSLAEILSTLPAQQVATAKAGGKK